MNGAYLPKATWTTTVALPAADPVTAAAGAEIAGHLDPSMAEQATVQKEPT